MWVWNSLGETSINHRYSRASFNIFEYSHNNEGEIQAFAGTGTGGHKDGPSGSSQFNYPRGIDVDQQNGDAYVAEHSSHTIRKISQGNLNLLLFNYWKQNKGQVSTVAGTPGKAGYVDGHNQSALFSYPYDLRFSKHHQALFVCDNSNNKLRKVSLNNGIIHYLSWYS